MANGVIAGLLKWGQQRPARREAQIHRLEEVEMSGKVFQIIVVIALVAAALLIVKPIASANVVASADQQARHQYRLTEHYGEAPQQSVAQQSMRPCEERYGEAAQPVVSARLTHLYQMGERYGE